MHMTYSIFSISLHLFFLLFLLREDRGAGWGRCLTFRRHSLLVSLRARGNLILAHTGLTLTRVQLVCAISLIGRTPRAHGTFFCFNLPLCVVFLAQRKNRGAGEEFEGVVQLLHVIRFSRRKLLRVYYAGARLLSCIARMAVRSCEISTRHYLLPVCTIASRTYICRYMMFI